MQNRLPVLPLIAPLLLTLLTLSGCGGGSGSIQTSVNNTGAGNGCGGGGAVNGTIIRRQSDVGIAPLSGIVVVFIGDQTAVRRQFLTDEQGQFLITGADYLVGKIQVLQSSPRFTGQRPYDNSAPIDPPIVGTYYVAAEVNVGTGNCGSQTVTLQIP